jgi:hypothetical protein
MYDNGYVSQPLATVVTTGKIIFQKITHRSFQTTEMKGKVPTHAVKVKRVTRNTGIVSFTSAIMEVSDQRYAPAVLPLEKNPVTI